MKSNKIIAIGALVGAAAGAAFGAYLQKAWAAEPIEADDFGMRLAKLESEIEELEESQRKRRRRAGTAGTVPFSAMRGVVEASP